MTVEQIKAEIKAYMITAQGTCFSTNKDFPRGLVSGLSFALEVLDKLEPSWHPYPKEVPLVSDVYRVTLDVSPFAITRDLYYNSVTGLWQLPRGGGELNVDVIAWMELPKPYKKESNNDH